MDVNELVRDDHKIGRHARHAATDTLPIREEPGDTIRLRCADVARNRARRYVMRHRTPKSLRPLIAVAIMIGLLFERRPIPTLLWPGKWPASGSGDTGPVASVGTLDREGDRDPVAQPSNGDQGSAVSGDPVPRYLPPADFLATEKDIAQIIAFLIRNRGRIDTDAVRMKWEILDRFSLSLAIFIREIEATAAWDNLEREISDTQPSGPIVSESGNPKSFRHRKILHLLPEWTLRGEKLLSGDGIDGTGLEPTPTVDGDDPDTKPPKP